MKTIIIIALVTLSFCANEYAKEDNVVVLTDDNFDEYLENHEHVLVKFYAPWCGHCKKLAPEFSKAAAILEKENLFLAQVDATSQKKLAEKFEIRGYPTVKLFIKKNPIEYNGGRTESEIVNWMRKKTGPPTKKIDNEEDVKKFQKDNEVCLIYFGDNKVEINEFEKVARLNEEFPFAVVEKASIIENLKVKKNSVVLFKKFDELKNELTTNINEKTINEFINKNSTPLVIKFDDKGAQLIFGKNQPAIFLYRDKNSEKTAELDKIMTEVSKEIKDKIKTVITDIKDGMEQRLAEYIGIKASDLPTVRIADTTIDLKKYNMQGEITKENILKFVDDWQNKRLKPSLKSQEIPKEQKGPVLTVVGKSFKKEVIENDKDVLVKFYAPWCGHCKKLAPEYEAAAKELANNKKLVLAEVDATENEVEEVTIQGFPTVKFWAGNNKKQPIDFNGERTKEGIIKFLQEKCYNKLTFDSPKEGKKDEKNDEKKQDL